MNAQELNSSSGRVTVQPAVAEILASSDVWDMTLPWLDEYQDISILARFRQAGYTFVSATTEDFPPTFEGVQQCIQRFRDAAKPHAEWLTFGSSLAEIDQGRQQGKLVIGLNIQDTVQLGTDLSRVEALYALGVRHMLLAYNVRNFVADGCAEPADAGLSIFGRQVVREMDRVGMVLDLSHTGRRSTLDAMEICERPPIFSHSGAHAVCAHIRNIRDEQIRACAARGGVIGVVGIGAFIGDAEARSATVFRHIDHIASLVGPQHVGLGADYVQNMAGVWDAIRAAKDSSWPDPSGTQLYEGGCFQPEQLAELVEIMLAHGYPVDVVKGILGANFRRVYAMAEGPAARA
ncbi:dipeptidase [Peristeroidobacter agariperforans]|uniref:dipeptidase n=1 Tax=Peristeroidobacter agariperforans TaxID=268404 RepID=UPI00101CC1ED|nr:membrane dipeptidase [Peristeroidobacter agariperforans]